MVTVLPHALSHYKRSIWIQFAEHLHAHLLRVNKTVLLLSIERMRADYLPTFSFEGFRENSFHPGLFRPALLIGGEPQIAIRHQVELFGLQRVFCFQHASVLYTTRQTRKSLKLFANNLVLFCRSQSGCSFLSRILA